MKFKNLFSKAEWSWIMYDWANSVYPTNIMAAIYPTIFASAVEGGDIRWGYATSIATFIVAILAPFLGSIADYKGMKKNLFAVFAVIGIVFTPLMAFTGNWKLCLAGYVLSRIGFSGSCLFYDSFLTDVTTDERMDKVSSWGYAMGYIGGSTIPFIISIAMLLIFDYNRLSQTFSVLIVSLWWAVFTIPFLKNVKHEHYIERPEHIQFKSVFANVVETFKSICSHKGLLIFVIAYFFYIDGVDTIISISTAYGTTLGLGTTGMILALLVTQIVAVPCSIWFAKLAEKHSARKALTGAVAVYLIITLLGFYMGFSMEPSQTAYESIIDNSVVSIEVDNSLKDDFDAYIISAKSKLKNEDATAALAEIGNINDTEAGILLTEQVNTALIAAISDNSAAVDAFNKAISFSTVLFWIMAVMVGTVQGGIQAVSRSYFGKLVPKEHSNEYYGFFDIFGKFASVVGPLIYSGLASITGRSSYGVLGLSMLFLFGMAMLVFGRKQLDSLSE